MFSFRREEAKNEQKAKIDIGAFDDITVQLINIAKRMALIEELHGTGWGGELETVIAETVRGIAAGVVGDEREIFKTLDAHTNVREYLERVDFEYAFSKEVYDGSQNPREETR